MSSHGPATGSIGIDFGTTNSVVARATATGAVDLVDFATPDGPAQVFRSALCFWQDETVRQGLADAAGPWAIAEFLDFPSASRFIQSFKSVAANPAFEHATLFAQYQHSNRNSDPVPAYNIPQPTSSKFSLNIGVSPDLDGQLSQSWERSKGQPSSPPSPEPRNPHPILYLIEIEHNTAVNERGPGCGPSAQSKPLNNHSPPRVEFENSQPVNTSQRQRLFAPTSKVDDSKIRVSNRKRTVLPHTKQLLLDPLPKVKLHSIKINNHSYVF